MHKNVVAELARVPMPPNPENELGTDHYVPRFSDSNTAPTPIKTIPPHSRKLGRSPRNRTANTATMMTLSLSMGAT